MKQYIYTGRLLEYMNTILSAEFHCQETKPRHVSVPMWPVWWGFCGLYSRTLTDTNRPHLLYINTTTTSKAKFPKELLRYLTVLKKSRNDFDCLVHEVLFIRELLKPILKCKETSFVQPYLYDFASHPLCKLAFAFLFTWRICIPYFYRKSYFLFCLWTSLARITR